jgi:hypothetical protein
MILQTFFITSTVIAVWLIRILIPHLVASISLGPEAMHIRISFLQNNDI